MKTSDIEWRQMLYLLEGGGRPKLDVELLGRCMPVHQIHLEMLVMEESMKEVTSTPTPCNLAGTGVALSPSKKYYNVVGDFVSYFSSLSTWAGVRIKTTKNCSRFDWVPLNRSPDQRVREALEEGRGRTTCRRYWTSVANSLNNYNHDG